MTGKNPGLYKGTDMVPVTHLKLLLFAGGSFSQAPCRACSLLSWSWMLQNGTQNTGCLNVKMYEIQKSSVIPSGYRLGGLDPVVVQLVRHQRLWQLPQVWLQRTWSRGDKAQVLKCTHLLKQIMTQLAEMHSWIRLLRRSSPPHSIDINNHQPSLTTHANIFVFN